MTEDEPTTLIGADTAETAMGVLPDAGQTPLVSGAPAVSGGDGTGEGAGDARHWYVIHTYSGYENKVKTNLEHRIDSMGVRDKIFQVIIPTEEEIEIKDGQRRTVQKKVYPGYVMVEMAMDDDAWYVVRNTPGVFLTTPHASSSRSMLTST